MGKNKKIKKILQKTSIISDVKLTIGTNTYEAGKEYSVSQNIAEFIKTTGFYKKGTIKIIDK